MDPQVRFAPRTLFTCISTPSNYSTASTRSTLFTLAREFSPRVERAGPGCVVFDASGLVRLVGDARAIENAITDTARARLRRSRRARLDFDRRVRVAGAVITRQRPGTAKGFVFLTLEDETGIANIIVRPDLFAAERLTIVEQPFLLVEGTLQIQDGVTSVKAERVFPIGGLQPAVELYDFH